MPGQHSPDREPVSFQAPRDLAVKLKKAARRQGADVATLLTNLIEEKYGNIKLSAQDFECIAEATRRAKKEHRRIATILPLPPLA